MSTNPRACADRVWVDIDRVAGSGYLGQDEVTLEVSCRRPGCAWQAPSWDPRAAGPLGVDDLLEFQKAHDRWVEETERVQIGAEFRPEFSSGEPWREVLLDGRLVALMRRSSLTGAYQVSWEEREVYGSYSTLEQVRRAVEQGG